ncbi:hypothetical protein MACH09_34890 [Vibrio sp. MACH09]|uniref:hypothetical protein n=1 Tax=Vibrio sp. MACH09 TaxID=3025122 RepID=UPI00278EA907|nr:hypothetical protein [Vibrio sp. MACH09]GLO62981.1 hypothetical protein MACH09_34890 [Vibrio sp. MACH09]
MTRTEQLIETLEANFPEGSPRRTVGRILITSDKRVSIRNMVDITGLSTGSVTSAVEALRRIFVVSTVVVDKLQHHTIPTSDSADSIDIPDLVNKSLMSSTPDGYNPNGYFKGIGYGSIQL